MSDKEPTSLWRRLYRLPFVYSVAGIPNGKTEMLRWLIAVRGNIAVALLVTLLIAVYIVGVPIDSAGYLVVIGCALILTNYIYSLILHRHTSSERTMSVLREVMIPFDLVFATLAVYVSGGALSPMSIAYTLGVLMSIILLDPTGVYRTACIAVVMYSGLVLLEAYQLIPHISLFPGGPGLYGAATFTTYAYYLLTVCAMLLGGAYVGNRIALMIGKRNRQIEHQVRDLHTLYDIADELGQATDEHEIAVKLADTLKTLQGATCCIVCMANKDGKHEIVASAGLALEELSRLRNRQQDTPNLKSLFEQGEPIIIEDIDKHPEYKALTDNPRICSVYMFPIKADDKALGTISLAFDRPRSLREEYKALLTTIANQVGMAIQRVRLFNNTERLAHEMSTLYTLGLYTGSTLSRNEIIKRTSDNIERLMNPDMYYIALYDAETESIDFELFKEFGQALPMPQAKLEAGGLTGHIIQSGKPLLVQDWLADGREYNPIALKMGVDMFSYLGVPMIFDGRVTGALSVQCVRPNAFNAHDERLLQAMAAQTAMALENARLHQLAQEGATTDSLTKVYNHGCFVEMIHKAVAASDRDDSQVSLIMLDIDHFKQYNDTYGHAAGDNVLALVGDVLKKSVRECDSVGRWGGEEFGVLLPGAGLHDAKKIARTIRRAIAELAPVDGRGRHINSPTISQGISSYPAPSTSAAHLIEEADAALYHAKEHGRNQLVISEAIGVMNEATLATHDLSYMMLKDATITTGNLIERRVASSE